MPAFKPSIKLPARRARGRRVVGLDIEPGAIHVAEAAPGPGGKLVVQRAAMRALDPGVVREGEIVDPEALAEALRALFDEHGFDRRVRIGVANQRIVVRTLDLPPITDPKELAQAVRFQAPSEVPMPLDQAVVDHVSLGIVETPAGPRTRVVLVAARRELIDRLLGVAREAGLKPEGIDLSAFALVRSLSDRSAAPVAYLAVGGTVNLVVSRGGQCLFTRVIAGGLEAMAIEHAERHEIPVEQARTELREGFTPRPEPIAEVEPVVEVEPVAETEPVIEIEPVLAVEDDDAGIPVNPNVGLDLTALVNGLPGEPEPEPEPARAASAAPAPALSPAQAIVADGVRRIAGEVRASLDFHLGAELAGPDGPAAVERIVLTGPGVSIPGLAEALSEHLLLPVETGHVAGPADADPGRYAVAAGLAVEELAA